MAWTGNSASRLPHRNIMGIGHAMLATSGWSRDAARPGCNIVNADWPVVWSEIRARVVAARRTQQARFRDSGEIGRAHV